MERLRAILLLLPIGLIIAMMLSEVTGITGRLFLFQVSGSGEITGFLGAVFISLSIFFATIKDSNVSVMIFISRLKGRKRAVSEIFISLVSMVSIGLLAWPGLLYARKMQLMNERSLLLNFSVSYIRYAFVFGLILVLCVLCRNLYNAIIDAVKK